MRVILQSEGISHRAIDINTNQAINAHGVVFSILSDVTPLKADIAQIPVVPEELRNPLQPTDLFVKLNARDATALLREPGAFNGLLEIESANIELSYELPVRVIRPREGYPEAALGG